VFWTVFPFAAQPFIRGKRTHVAGLPTHLRTMDSLLPSVEFSQRLKSTAKYGVPKTCNSTSCVTRCNRWVPSCPNASEERANRSKREQREKAHSLTAQRGITSFNLGFHRSRRFCNVNVFLTFMLQKRRDRASSRAQKAGSTAGLRMRNPASFGLRILHTPRKVFSKNVRGLFLLKF
jgi:hypothetical protein